LGVARTTIENSAAPSPLRACPHAEKPRCHHCPHPCYEREMWVNMARMMKYSGMKLGFTKIKKFFSFAKS